MTCQGAFWGLRSTRSQSTSLVMPEAEPHNQCMMSGKVPKHWTFKTHKGVYVYRAVFNAVSNLPQIQPQMDTHGGPSSSCKDSSNRHSLLRSASAGGYYCIGTVRTHAWEACFKTSDLLGILQFQWILELLGFFHTPLISHLWEFKNLVTLCQITPRFPRNKGSHFPSQAATMF